MYIYVYYAHLFSQSNISFLKFFECLFLLHPFIIFLQIYFFLNFNSYFNRDFFQNFSKNKNQISLE